MSNLNEKLCSLMDYPMNDFKSDLASAIVKLLGGEKDFLECVDDVVENGDESHPYTLATTGYNLVDFFETHKIALSLITEKVVIDNGWSSTIEYVQDRVGSDFYSLADVATAIHKDEKENPDYDLRTAVASVFIWNAVETLCLGLDTPLMKEWLDTLKEREAIE